MTPLFRFRCWLAIKIMPDEMLAMLLDGAEVAKRQMKLANTKFTVTEITRERAEAN